MVKRNAKDHSTRGAETRGQGENDNGTRRFQLPKTTNMGEITGTEDPRPIALVPGVSLRCVPLVKRRCSSSLCQSRMVGIIWLEWRQKLVVQMLAHSISAKIITVLTRYRPIVLELI